MDFKRLEDFSKQVFGVVRGECFMQKQQHESRGVDTSGTLGKSFHLFGFQFPNIYNKEIEFDHLGHFQV